MLMSYTFQYTAKASPQECKKGKASTIKGEERTRQEQGKNKARTRREQQKQEKNKKKKAKAR
jgi:hypothetical protein